MAISANAQQAVQHLQSLPPEDQRDAVATVMTANPDLFPHGDKARTNIWMTLLVGLFVLALAAIIATVILAWKDKEGGTAVVALATAIVAGVIGLFANPPTS